MCPWSLALASSIPVLGLESVCPRKGCPWPWPWIFFVSLALASSLCVLDSTSAGFINKYIIGLNSEMEWRGYSVLGNYQSLVSILFPLAPLQLFFSINMQMKQITPCQCRRCRDPRGPCPPLTTACAPPFWCTQITVFGTPRNCKTTTMMVKGVITFKHDSPLKFS